MNEFDPLPEESTPVTSQAPLQPKKESLLTRPLFMGQSLPWLIGGSLALVVAGWYLLWPASSTPDASQLAFGPDNNVKGMEQAVAVAPEQSPLVPLPTSGLVGTTAPLNATKVDGSVPEEVVKLIREGREFEEANREAINRLSDTVRAQTKALATLQQQLGGVAQESERLTKQLTELSARPSPDIPKHADATRKTRRNALSDMRLESLNEGMAWVRWQGRTWAVQPGDNLGGVTVHDVNVSERSVVTSAGVLR